jgi:DNA adenine methylase
MSGVDAKMGGSHNPEVTVPAQPTLIPAPSKPVVKWAGGKTQLLPEIISRLPKTFASYHEPFLGGAAVFFGLSPETATLSDTNAHLVGLYRAIRDDHESLGNALNSLQAAYNQMTPDEQAEAFYLAREEFNSGELSSLRRSVLFLFLNKAGFNGLYRENAKGYFNVPFGRRRHLGFPSAENLAACSESLQRATLSVASFEEVANRATPGDFVYFDPPYVPLTAESSFTAYQAGGFGLAQQKLLAELFAALTKRGVYALLSNSHTSLVTELYGDFTIDVVHARRNINSKGDRRGSVEEVLVRNY